MIKINLLNSVTERQGGTVVAVDRKVASPGTRMLLMTLSVGFLLIALVAWDVISTQWAKAEAERQREEQKQIAAELESVMKEQKDLETKIAAIDARIAAIKKLRDEQKGPSAVLESLRERIAMVPGLYLQSVVQEGNKVTISGNSPSEDTVTQFGRSLEFSNGLFSNLNIETKREELTNQLASAPVGGGEAPKVGIVNFKITAAYDSAKGNTNPSMTAANTPGQAPAAPAVQVAKN